LDILRQQVAGSKLLSAPVERVTLLLRSADIVWTADQSTAREVFKEALEVARQDYRVHFERSEKIDSSETADLRYKVISAIAKRDVIWAGKLSDEILKEQERRAEDGATVNSKLDSVTAERLLSVALSMLPSDLVGATRFATASLRYPATTYLPIFLYQLSAIDQSAADQFYAQALSTYAEKPMNQFLFLSSYPFGNNREAGEMPNWTIYRLPPNFRTSASLQRAFTTTLIRRARNIGSLNVSVTTLGARYSEKEQAWIALTRLKAQIDQFLPDLSGQADSIKSTLLPSSDSAQARLPDADTTPVEKSFTETIEQADRLTNPARREQQLAIAVLHSKDALLPEVLSAISKIDDADLRENLLSWVYFDRAQKGIEEDWEQAKSWAEKVRELDLRAYLFAKIAEQSIKNTNNDTSARELLEAVLDAAAKAPDTETKSRALIGVAYLYSQIDANRSIAVLADAAKCINKIDSPDFSNDYIERKIKGQTFTSYAILNTPGFNPLNSFRELSKIDFDGAFTLANSVVQKYLRALILLTLSEECLQSSSKVQSSKRVR
jgi:hypothetical protein